EVDVGRRKADSGGKRVVVDGGLLVAFEARAVIVEPELYGTAQQLRHEQVVVPVEIHVHEQCSCRKLTELELVLGGAVTVVDAQQLVAVDLARRFGCQEQLRASVRSQDQQVVVAVGVHVADGDAPHQLEQRRERARRFARSRAQFAYRRKSSRRRHFPEPWRLGYELRRWGRRILG